MKKKTIQLVVVLVLLIGAVAAYFILDKLDSPAEENSATEEIYALGGIPQPFVKEVSVQNQVDSLRIVNGYANAVDQYNNADELKYSLDGMDTSQLTMSMLQSVMTAAANLTAKKEVHVEGSDLSVYGLDVPVATVNVTYEEGSAQMKIGGEAPGGEGTYAAVGDKVYLITSTKLTNFLGSRLSFVSKTITPGNSQSTVLTRAEISGQKYPQPIIIEKAAEADKASSLLGTDTYKIVSPIQSGVDTQSGITPLMSVFGLMANAVVGNVADGLDQWGLSQPYVVTSIEAEDAEVGFFVLSVSTPDPEGNVYLTVNISPFVYQMSGETLLWLDKTLFDYREKTVILPFIDKVAKVEVKIADGVHTFTLSGEGDNLTVTADGKDLKADIFRKFYQTLISASYDEEIPQEETVESKDASAADSEKSNAELVPAPGTEKTASPANFILQYTYTYRDGSPSDVVTLRSGGGARRAIVSLNGGREYLTKSTYVDRVLEDLPKVLAGQEVKSYL